MRLSADQLKEIRALFQKFMDANQFDAFQGEMFTAVKAANEFNKRDIASSQSIAIEHVLATMSPENCRLFIEEFNSYFSKLDINERTSPGLWLFRETVIKKAEARLQQTAQQNVPQQLPVSETEIKLKDFYTNYKNQLEKLRVTLVRASSDRYYENPSARDEASSKLDEQLACADTAPPSSEFFIKMGLDEASAKKLKRPYIKNFGIIFL